MAANKTTKKFWIPLVGLKVGDSDDEDGADDDDDGLIKGLVGAGMDVARINCAHDGRDEWVAMAERVRRG